ncbi:MAG TPA: hypothetical protein DIW47_14620 [Bacteroidetes bacterium]|nr:hypothetical protein [Bacteroidota bacterium]
MKAKLNLTIRVLRSYHVGGDLKLAFMFAVISMLLFVPKESQAQTIVVQTTIKDSSSTWTNDGSPYRIQGDIFIEEDGSLLILSDCELIFEGNYGIYVKGVLQVKGNPGRTKLQGMDLGNGKHVLWKGIKKSAANAYIRLDSVDILDSEIAVDYSGFPYASGSNPFATTACHFYNNLVALKSGPQGGGSFSCSGVTFTNNNIAVMGDYSSIDSVGAHGTFSFYQSTFEENGIGIQNATFKAESCQFRNNGEAIRDAFYCEIDSTGFSNNKLAISGYALVIERTVFYANDKGIVHTGRNTNRDKVLRNSILRSNHFESNKEALFTEDGAMIDELSCNLFFMNTIALVVPDSLYNANAALFRVERNVFVQNDLAIQVLELEANFTPAPGSTVQAVQFLYNALTFNFIIIDHSSPNNLNFFNNYILANKFLIDLGVVDGDDQPGLGLINYTVSGDTTYANSFITVNKIQDVIKHPNYDSALIAGNTYTFEICASMPGNGVGIEPLEELMEVKVFPNPFRNEVHIEWEYESVFDFHLYGLTGQEIPLKNPGGLASPAHFDLEYLEPGIYFLRAISGNEVRSFKLIKK